MSGRTYHDPLHGAIHLSHDEPAEALAIALVDTPPFQRLRRIRQLGPAFLTFHGAEFSRFTHSLGVLHLARLALGQLEPLQPALGRHRALLYAAALLHDVGHGPLSHAGEEMYGLQHEVWSGRLVRDHPDLRSLLDGHSPGLADAVGNLLERGQSPCQAVKALVSSQLDCDRLDYLLRDSYSTGTTYGRLDLQRILSALTLAPDGGLAVHPKGLMAVEHYLVVRNLMYRSVYNHRLNVVCNWLLRRLVSVARQLGPQRVWADPVMACWLWEPSALQLDTYLANDDLRTGYHLQRWMEEAPPDLADPCRRLLERRLLKATDVSALEPGHRLELLALAQRLAGAAGLDPEGCCALELRQNRGYHPYAGGLRLWDGRRLEALERRSPLVQSLSQPMETAWLIHPGVVTPKLREHLEA